MVKNESSEIIDVLLNVFRRKKWLIILSTLLISLTVIFYNETAPSVYESNTTLAFEELNNPVTSYDYDQSREVFFSNQLEEIKSISFANDIIELLPKEIVDAELKKISTEKDIDKNFAFSSKIQKNLSAYFVKNSNILQINFRSQSPSFCKLITNTAAEVLTKRNVEFRTEDVGSVRQFIEKQLVHYKMKLDSSEMRLKSYKEKHRITSIDKESQAIMRRLTEAEIQSNSVRSDLESTQKRISTLNSRLTNQKRELVPSVVNLGGSWAQKLRERLIDLNVQYMNLKIQGYDTNHPKMVDLENDIERVKKDLTEKALELAQNEKSANPITQMENYINEIVTLQIELESQKASYRALRTIVSRYNNQLASIPAKEFELTRLTRERDANQKIYASLLEKREEAKISEAEKAKNIRIIDKAYLPKDPVLPRKKLNLVIGIFLGLLLGTGVSFVAEMRTNNIESPEEMEEIINLPLISQIPDFDKLIDAKLGKYSSSKKDKNSEQNRRYKALLSVLEPHTAVTEAFKMLRTNLFFSGIGKDLKTVLVTSIGPGDGKTTTLTNLGITYAHSGLKTLIVDSDLRIPRIHKFFGVENNMGVSELLNDFRKLDEVSSKNIQPQNAGMRGRILANMKIHFDRSITDTDIPNLKFLPSGNSKDLLDTAKSNLLSLYMPTLLHKLKNHFNVILIDSAPLLLVNDTFLLANMVDSVLLVIPPNKYNEEVILSVRKNLSKASSNVVGFIMNGVELRGNYKYYYKNYYRESAEKS